ncbi:MAG: efflux RND transporter periplasmic adaptor subunit, partial [Devosia sp.]|nr:efflux RND transporter periplasmic adaptor subunit [Devosia sp.]
REDAEGDYVLKLGASGLVRQGVSLGQAWDRGRTVEVTGLEVGDVIVGAALSGLAAGEAYEVVED